MSHAWLCPVSIGHAAHMNESCRTGTCGSKKRTEESSHHRPQPRRFLFLKSLTSHINISCHTHERVMSHVCIRLVTFFFFFFVYVYGLSLMCMCHVTHMNSSYYTYKWVTSHIWTSHVTRSNASGHTYSWVMSQTWMSLVTHIERVMSHVRMSHITHVDV